MDLAVTASLCAVLVSTWAASTMLLVRAVPAPVNYHSDVIVRGLSDTDFHFHMTK